MKAKILSFPSSRSRTELRAICDVLKALADYSAPMARSHSARLYLSGVLNEGQYERALMEIDGERAL